MLETPLHTPTPLNTDEKVVTVATRTGLLRVQQMVLIGSPHLDKRKKNLHKHEF